MTKDIREIKEQTGRIEMDIAVLKTNVENIWRVEFRCVEPRPPLEGRPY